MFQLNYQSIYPHVLPLHRARLFPPLFDGRTAAVTPACQLHPAADSPSSPHSPSSQVLEERYPTRQELLRIAEAVTTVRHVFQFSRDPLHGLARWDARHELHPEDDATTFVLKALMRNLCERGQVPASRCSGSPVRAGPASVVSLSGHGSGLDGAQSDITSFAAARFAQVAARKGGEPSHAHKRSAWL